ncbi:MAG TPA: hypothetical protein VFQ53_36875 [Kofleriaceae bacterium]|nr:hypothetical protein [Kofleriaceae bacterium]
MGSAPPDAGDALESRDRMIAEARRKALIDDASSARAGLVGGPVLVVLGAGLLWFVTQAIIGLASVFVGGIGCILISLGIAVLARSIYKRRTSFARLRELDAERVPAARIVRK